MGKSKPGILIIAWIDRGVDVLTAVRKWEREKKLGPIEAGKQDEVLVQSLPKTKIIGCWHITKGVNFNQVIIKMHEEVNNSGFPQDIVNRYKKLADEYHPDSVYKFSILIWKYPK